MIYLYKVLLADDEFFVRHGLKSLIEWEKCGYEVAAEADNGEDAFKLVQEIKPDLVITDIRMPVFDGLQLIQKVNETLSFNTKFIIISGYNDFSYAQKAVRFGAVDFVLKPIDQDELEAALIKLAATLDQEKATNSDQEKVLLDQIFIHSLGENKKENEVRRWAAKLNINNRDFYYYLLLEVNNLSLDKGFINEQYKEPIRKVIRETVARQAATEEYTAIYEQLDHAYGLLITSEHLKKFNGQIEPLAEKLRKDIQDFTNIPLTVYVGAKTDDLSTIKKSYETANSLRNYKYIFNEKNVFIHEQTESVDTTYDELNNHLFVTLMEQIEENNSDRIVNIIDKIFSEFQTKKFVPSAVKTSVNRCVHKVMQTVQAMEGDTGKIIFAQAMTNWESYNLTFGQLKQVFTKFVLEAAVIIQELRKENMKSDIYKVKTYIENHYHENISLKSIASLFYMNPVYMGQLFKKTFGVYFKEYLLKLRINEAKKLLRQTDMRVYEVAERVGFGSTDYFVTQFEKINKMTPTEYRNKLLK
ncbi:response regulator [Halalkalibacterium halodurans]|uniref:response regulator n=1 Tax=Halalkalibacterium halodurans TaxID=86665 RepID=UPI002E22EB51|nr:response regulator [Halalkalibacterium halodurans]MED3647533.1 response regulator [Halalkalibacterium halodurans]